MRLGADWFAEYTFREFEALCKAYRAERDERYLCASMVATAVYNVNRDSKVDPLPLDAFVPKEQAEEAEQTNSKAELLKEKAKLWQAKFERKPPKQ